ncbi:hypothetical protein ACM4MP_005086 [Escherichia coli]|nr:helix-turn-helix transcriptional regulator [Escherichia coli]
MRKNIVQNIVNKIEDRINLNKRIDLNEVDNLSGYSARYIHKIFKDVTGVSVSLYIKKEY